jgi:copper(I)-binding protein
MLLLAAGCRTNDEYATVVGSSLRITGAIAPAPVVAGPLAARTMAIYLTMANVGDKADTLQRATTDIAGVTMLHDSARGSAQSMSMAATVAIPAKSVVRLEPRGYHIMLEQLKREIRSGDSLELTVEFRYAGQGRVTVRVVKYAELEALLERRH